MQHDACYTCPVGPDIAGFVCRAFAMDSEDADRIFLRKIRNTDNVILAYMMDDGVFRKAMEIERKETASNEGMVNIAMEETGKRDYHMFVLSTDMIDPTPFPPMTIVNDYGEVSGFFVHGKDRSLFREEDGYTWLSDDLVIDSKVRQGRTHFVVQPHRLEVVGRSEGIKDAISFLPCRKTDGFLRSLYCFDEPSLSMTAIVSYNHKG